MTLLTCSTCGVDKPTHDYHLARSLSRGFQYSCKVCIRRRNQKSWANDPAIRERHRVASRRRNQKFRAANGPAWRAGMLNQKAKKFGVAGRVTIEELRIKWEEYDGRCALAGPECLGDATEWDHAVPLTRYGATNWVDNLLPSCRSCNARKNNLTLIEWRRECRYRLGQECGWVHPLALIGDPPESREHWGKPGIEPYIAATALVEAFVSVDAGIHRVTYVGERTWLGKHVHLGHDCIVGDDCEIAPGAVLGGNVELGSNVKVGMNATVRPRVKIGDGARVGMGAVVTKDVPAGMVVVGNPARDITQDPRLDPLWASWYESRDKPR